MDIRQYRTASCMNKASKVFVPLLNASGTQNKIPIPRWICKMQRSSEPQRFVKGPIRPWFRFKPTKFLTKASLCFAGLPAKLYDLLAPWQDWLSRYLRKNDTNTQREIPHIYNTYGGRCESAHTILLPKRPCIQTMSCQVHPPEVLSGSNCQKSRGHWSPRCRHRITQKGEKAVSAALCNLLKFIT